MLHTGLEGAEPDAKQLHREGLAQCDGKERGGHEEGGGADAEGVAGEMEPCVLCVCVGGGVREKRRKLRRPNQSPIHPSIPAIPPRHTSRAP